MKTLDEVLAEIEAHQAAREQHPTAVTTVECRRLIAALRVAYAALCEMGHTEVALAASMKIAEIVTGASP